MRRVAWFYMAFLLTLALGDLAWVISDMWQKGPSVGSDIRYLAVLLALLCPVLISCIVTLIRFGCKDI